MSQTVHAAVVCSKGCVRGNNEDNFYFNGDLMEPAEMDAGAVLDETFTDDFQFYAVADGMGGGDNGERASALAVKLMVSGRERLRTGNVTQELEQLGRHMNQVIHADGEANSSNTEGSTLAALVLRDGQAFVGNVGDSRVYSFQGGRLTQISWDHSTVADLHRAGQMTEEQARKSPMNNMITRFMGMDEEETPSRGYVYQTSVPLRQGMRFMLCSDGLSDLISRDRLEQLMALDAEPLGCAARLVNTALEEGGKDNTTCIMLDIR